MKMMTNDDNGGKITVEGKFPFVLCKKNLGSNSIISQICRCSVHKRCNSIRGKLKEGSAFKCQTYANQQTDIGKDCSDIELNGQS